LPTFASLCQPLPAFAYLLHTLFYNIWIAGHFSIQLSAQDKQTLSATTATATATATATTTAKSLRLAVQQTSWTLDLDLTTLTFLDP
jgi:hypothetical protein